MPLDASRKKANWKMRTAGPILPFPGSNTPAKELKPPFSVFRINLSKEMASPHNLYHSSTTGISINRMKNQNGLWAYCCTAPDVVGYIHIPGIHRPGLMWRQQLVLYTRCQVLQKYFRSMYVRVPCSPMVGPVYQNLPYPTLVVTSNATRMIILLSISYDV